MIAFVHHQQPLTKLNNRLPQTPSSPLDFPVPASETFRSFHRENEGERRNFSCHGKKYARILFLSLALASLLQKQDNRHEEMSAHGNQTAFSTPVYYSNTDLK
nr:uncharacterized protein LOC113716434 [Coffea arabica]